MTLAEREVAAFRREGFVLPRQPMAPGLVARLAALVAGRAAADADGTEADGIGAPPVPGDPIATWAGEACLADLVAPLLGSPPWLWRYSVVARGAASTPWRPAGAAWSDCPAGAVFVRVALDAVDRGNGCLRLLPRPHERLVREIRNARQRRALALPPDRIDPAITVEAVRQSGELTLYDVETFQCEPENPSDRARAAVVFHYAAAGAAGHPAAVRRSTGH
jgi:hypothetical protein